MQPIATMTKIHGKGNIEAIMNDVLNTELMRQREEDQRKQEEERKEHAIEIRCMKIWTDMLKDQLDDMRKEKYDAFVNPPRKTIGKRILNAIEEVYAFCFGCILVFLMWVKLLEYGYYDENGEWNKIS